MAHSKHTRATVIVELNDGILLAETPRGDILLPGGRVEKRETPMMAAIRELREETRLEVIAILFLFEYESFANYHKIFWAYTSGSPVAQDDAVRLHYTSSLEPTQRDRLSPATRTIIQRFNEQRKTINLLNYFNTH